MKLLGKLRLCNCGIVGLYMAENGGKLMFPKEVLCPGQSGCAFIAPEQKNEEGTHECVQKLGLVRLILIVFVIDLEKKPMDIFVTIRFQSVDKNWDTDR